MSEQTTKIDSIPVKPVKIVDLIKPPRRKLCDADILGIAKLVASKRMTDLEACFTLGINYGTFSQWKCRNSNGVKYSQLVSHARAIRIDALFDKVEEISTVRQDWRGFNELLKHTDRDRYGDRPAGEASVNNTTLNINLFAALKDKVYGQVVDVESSPVKAIENNAK
jgi:hypothetical protein